MVLLVIEVVVTVVALEKPLFRENGVSNGRVLALQTLLDLAL